MRFPAGAVPSLEKHSVVQMGGLSALVEEKLRALAPLRDDRAPIVENNRHVVPLTIVVSFSFLLGTYRVALIIIHDDESVNHLFFYL